MHNRTPVISTILVTTGLLGSLLAWSFNSDRSQNLKSRSLRPHNEILIRTAKLRPHFSVALSNRETPSALSRDHFILDATIETERDIPRLRYKWIVPSDVQMLASGALEGVLTHVPTRGGAILTAEFINSSSKNEKIYLRIWVDGDENTLVSSTQFNTLLQNEIDLEKSELVKRQNEYLGEHPELIKKFK